MTIGQPSVQWHLAQMLGEVILTPAQRADAVALVYRNLESSTDGLVLNFSLQTMAGFARDDPVLLPRFLGTLHRHALSPKKSVARRAGRLLEELDAGARDAL